MRKAILALVFGAVLGGFVLTPSDASLPTVVAKNRFLDGFIDQDRGLPSTSSVTNPAAVIAQLNLGRGKFMLFASILVSPHLGADNIDRNHWGGLITCVITPPNARSFANPTGNPHAKAEFQFLGTTSLTSGPQQQTLTTSTTTRGPGIATFACTDGSGSTKPSVDYRFLTFTSLRLQGLNQADIDS